MAVFVRTRLKKPDEAGAGSSLVGTLRDLSLIKFWRCTRAVPHNASQFNTQLVLFLIGPLYVLYLNYFGVLPYRVPAAYILHPTCMLVSTTDCRIDKKKATCNVKLTHSQHAALCAVRGARRRCGCGGGGSRSSRTQDAGQQRYAGRQQGQGFHMRHGRARHSHGRPLCRRPRTSESRIGVWSVANGPQNLPFLGGRFLIAGTGNQPVQVFGGGRPQLPLVLKSGRRRG
jgi:hypothetical protein